MLRLVFILFLQFSWQYNKRIFEKMENEDGYMVLNCRNHLKSRQRPKGNTSDFSWYLHYHYLMVVFVCIGILIFVMSILGFKFWMSIDKKVDFPQDIITHHLAENKSACSSEWLLNQGKCYRFLSSSKTWNESQQDCIKLQAHLLVIQSSKELEFIQMNLKLGKPGWIGLYFIISQGNQWMWIDKHPFVEQNNFLVIGSVDNRSCAVITGKQIYSEDCNSKFNGICQKEAVKTTKKYVLL